MKRFLRVAATLLLGWLLYSMTGTVPIAMSIPLPDFMHTGYSSLTNTGYTDANRLAYDLDSAIVKPGTLDGLELFTTGNLLQDAYYDPEGNAYYIRAVDGTYQLDASNPSDGALVHESLMRLALRIGRYDYLFAGVSDCPALASKKGSVELIQDWEMCMNVGPEVDAVRTGELLERQETEKITPRELAALLHMHSAGMLLGWYPAEHTAVLCLNKGEYTVVQTDSGKKQLYPLYDYRSALAVSPDELVAYDPGQQAVVLHRFSTGEQTVLVPGLPDLLTLNVTTAGGTLVVAGLADAHTAFLYSAASGEVTTLELGSDFDADALVFSDGEFLITDRIEGNVSIYVEDGVYVPGEDVYVDGIYIPAIDIGEGGFYWKRGRYS